jgi:isopenicillin-N epimerase
VNPLAGHWRLDPAVAYLNHGSFGACPTAVLAFQSRLREEMEAEAVTFLVRRLEDRLDEARTRLAAFLGAQAQDVAFVPNATTGVACVLGSLDLRAGDVVLTTDHAYNACRNALDRAAAASGATVRVAAVPFPLRDGQQVVDAIEAALTPEVRLALVDHVTSPTGLVLPLARMLEVLHARGVDVLVDGAHAPGMVPLDLDALGTAWYTGNLHKWVCAPKGAAFLHVRRDKQDRIRPAVTSHGANAKRADRSRFLLEFDWTGTFDPTPWLSVPVALATVGAMLPGGWDEVRRRNRELALRGRDLLCRALRIEAPAPDDMIGSLAALPLPPAGPDERPLALGLLPTQERLFAEHRIEVPVFGWPRLPQRVLRISAQLYNDASQYERLASALSSVL